MPLNNQAFKDGQTFYILAPGCDNKIRWQMLECEIERAFSSREKLKKTFCAYPLPSIKKAIEYYKYYKRGILDTMEKYPENVPQKVKKILAKYWRA